MTQRTWRGIRIEQCGAAEAIWQRHGIEPAFDCIVGEKLIDFAQTAEDDPELTRTLPKFVSRVRGMFTPKGLDEHLARVERQRLEQDMDATDVYDAELDDLAASEARSRCFEFDRVLLAVPVLGTS